MAGTVTNRYLEGPYAPVHEEVTAVDLPVTGTLPLELDGRYLRNGPNPFHPQDPGAYHWFTGDGMVHGVRLRDGKAEWYRNRWVRSTMISEALGEEPVPGDRSTGMELANTNVIGHAGATYAIVEAGGPPAELTEELDTVCFSDLGGTLRYGFTAHPRRDPQTGELHTVNYYWARPEVLDYTVVGADGRVVHQVDIAVPGNPMVHDCSITESSVLVYDLPCTFDLEDAMSGKRLPYSWNPDYGARVGVLPLHGEADEVQWFEIEPGYVYHSVNAWDDGDTVVVDVARYDRTFDRMRQGPDEGPPALWRWSFDRASGRAREEQLDDRPLEFPRIDERLLGRRHRWAWAAGLPEGRVTTDFDASTLVRIDAETGTCDRIDLGAAKVAGEFVFVPSADEAAEGDGWLMTFVYDTGTDRSDLVVLAAAAPEDGPVATVHLPVRVPLGFHGNWVPSGT